MDSFHMFPNVVIKYCFSNKIRRDVQQYMMWHLHKSFLCTGLAGF